MSLPKLIKIVSNFPYTLGFIFFGLVSFPKKISFDKSNYAVIIHVNSFWWTKFSYLRKARAMTFGYTILLGPKIKPTDLAHEFIHVKQFDRWPIIFPVLYSVQRVIKGKDNVYEKEAYLLSQMKGNG